MEISLIYAALFIVTILWCAMMLRWFVEANYPNVSIKKIDQWSKPAVLGPAGVSSIQGRRPHMEDTYQAAVNLGTDSKPAAFFGVYDGHGGSKAAVFTADHLHQLIAQKDFYNNPHEAIRSAFLTLDAQWLQQAHHNLWDDGTTAITALIVKNTLYVNNVGDSRCVLGFKGLAIEMSSDHKPDRDDEKDRIEALGGRIICYGTWRVEGMLAVTRAIGDRRLKKYVSAEPEIRERTLKEGDDFLILASDGVWDVLTNQEAVDITYRAKDVKVASEMLTDIAYKRGSMDNATAMVVDLSGYRS